MHLTTTALIGQLLLWLGFLGGSFSAVLRTENAESPWSTIPWGMYAGSVLVGVIGVVLLRREKAKQRSESASSDSDLGSVTESLELVSTKVRQLASQLDEMTCEEVLDYIDSECVPHCADFADGRQVIANRFGTAAYAAVMTEFASGERYLNRTWSAAADGYVDEVKLSIGHSNTFMDAAVTCLNNADKS